MAYKSNDPNFKDLTDEQEAEFREFGRTQKPSEDDLDRNGCLRDRAWLQYHPVIREEWLKRRIQPYCRLPRDVDYSPEDFARVERVKARAKQKQQARNERRLAQMMQQATQNTIDAFNGNYDEK